MLIFPLLLVCVIGSYLTATLPKVTKCSILVLAVDVDFDINILQNPPLASVARLFTYTRWAKFRYTVYSI